jgi:hypothetical protein
MEWRPRLLCPNWLSSIHRINRHLPTAAKRERLPWLVAGPLIGSLSLALWFGLWKLALRVLYG